MIPESIAYWNARGGMICSTVTRTVKPTASANHQRYGLRNSRVRAMEPTAPAIVANPSPKSNGPRKTGGRTKDLTYAYDEVYDARLVAGLRLGIFQSLFSEAPSTHDGCDRDCNGNE